MFHLNNIKIVLCNTSHQGNIGAAARAMKTMGIYNLVLVNPITKPDDHAIALASNAADVVTNATILNNLDEALSDTSLSFAMTARKRELCKTLFTPKESVKPILEATQSGQKVAIIFGSEKNGLTVEELEKCNRMITIPANPTYSSLNIAQAIQIVCYEIFSNSYNDSDSEYLNDFKPFIKLASFEANQGLLNHLKHILHTTNFYKNLKQTNRKLQHIIAKSSLEQDDIDLLRGILKHLDKKSSKETT